MKNIITALAVVAITAGTLIATEGASFAAVKHGKRTGIVKTVNKSKKTKKRFEEASNFARKKSATKLTRAHRRISKKRGSKPMNPNATGTSISG